MKRYRKHTYGYFFRKHFFVALVLWIVVLYVFLQICFLVIFEKEKQKTAVNFYEGMEKIQYLVKDHSLKDVEAEATQALEEMSCAGAMTNRLYMDGGVGSVLSVKLIFLALARMVMEMSILPVTVWDVGLFKTATAVILFMRRDMRTNIIPFI